MTVWNSEEINYSKRPTPESLLLGAPLHPSVCPPLLVHSRSQIFHMIIPICLSRALNLNMKSSHAIELIMSEILYTHKDYRVTALYQIMFLI